VRVGLELEQYNVFGRGHHSRLKVVQSLKSSSADYNYTLPELVGKDLDVLLNANALRRQEPTFERTELGIGAGVRKFFKSIDSDLGLRYNYQILDAAGREVDPAFGRTNAHVGAFIIDFKHDRRDNALLPHSGYKLFTTLEAASEYLGGNANYQRFEFAGSFHTPLDEGRWIHIGVVHGLVNTLDDISKNLPFNKRFFPGGENSIRGYQEGQAGPRNAFGQIVGAETYSLASFEFEQALTDSISLVVFNDDLAFAREIGNYPFNETLFTVGAGLRWKTVLGPVRFEYGYNLNPRKEDPVGTFHFSIGFPF
jgi:outer membrane protein insertion porin family